jgi:signal transduction histidine kinase
VNVHSCVDDRILASGGAMADLMRTIDWGRTPLGPMCSWPQSLKTAASICLTSKFPILVLWGRDLVQIYNDAYRPILGQKHPRAMGQPGRAVWSEIWDIVGPMVEGVLAHGDATWSEDQMLPMYRHGFVEETYFTFSYSGIRDESGGIGGVFCVVTETTGRVIGERRLRTLGQLATHGATSVQEVGRSVASALEYNRHDHPFAMLYQMDGAAGGRLAGAVGLEPGSPAAPLAIDVEDEDAAWPLAAVMRTGEPVRVGGLEGRLLPGGPWPEASREAWVLPVTRPGHGQPSACLILGISPRRIWDEDYRSYADLVCRAIGSGLATARDYVEEKRRAEQLAELDRSKTTFFANVSHEFRTPLTLMLGPIEEALADRDSPLSPPQRERQEIAYRNALRLQRLVTTVLDFSRIEAGRLQADFQPLDVAAVTTDLASAFRSAFERAAIVLRIICVPTVDDVFIDRDLWEKIVFNLLSNALKFTRMGSVEVHLQQDDAVVELSVADTGSGIASQELPRIFDRFHRAANPQARTQEGSGIGLSLVRDLVRLHGGTIGVASELGRGSTFTVRIPVGRDHLPADRISPRSSCPTTLGAAPFVEEALHWLPDSGMSRQLAEDDATSMPGAGSETVLLVDDNADMRDYVRRLLQPHWRVLTAPDGLAAMRLAAEAPPDLVLSDVMMPGLDGVGLLAALRENPETCGVPVILLSARAGEEPSIAARSAGADDYLVKPFTARELIARVRTHLAIARRQREAQAREQHLREELERSNVDLEQFAAAASHDLQEPLRMVTTYLELIEDRYGAVLDQRGRGLMAHAINGARRMRGLTSSLLEYAKVGGQAGAFRNVAMEGVLTDVRANLEQAITSTGAVLCSGALPDVHGNPMLLTRLLQNLIANAIKYRAQQPLEIHVDACEMEGEVVFSVRDNGLGIESRHQARLFQAFHRGAADPGIPGTGLGLATCKRIVERHGGRIWVESRPGHGSTFHFTLRSRAQAADGRRRRWGSGDEHLRSIFMQAPACIAIYRGPQHVCEFANPKYLEMVGRSTLVGKTIREAFPEAEGSGIFGMLDNVYRTGEPFVASEYPVPIDRRPGTGPEVCLFSFVLHPLRDQSGAISGQIVVALEITAQVLASRKLASLA